MKYFFVTLVRQNTGSAINIPHSLPYQNERGETATEEEMAIFMARYVRDLRYSGLFPGWSVCLSSMTQADINEYEQFLDICEA